MTNLPFRPAGLQVALAAAAALTLTSHVAAQDISPAETDISMLPSIVIYGLTPLPPAVTDADPHASILSPSADGGEFLRHVTGVSAGRMGGHGLEPVIRGLDQTQISVIADGAFQFGGCPNRMDPPSSLAQLLTYDRAVVTRGYQSVTQGAPAPGGVVEFKRDIMSFPAEGGYSVRAGSSYVSNGDRKEAYSDVAAGTDWGYVRAYGSYTDMGNYNDGDGNEIRSAFEQYGAGISLVRTIDANSYFALSAETNNIYDALFPGAGMDAPLTETWTFRLKGETDVDWGSIKEVKFEAYTSLVDHVMNNYELRELAAGKPALEAVTESYTYGGKLVFSGVHRGIAIDFGTDYRLNQRDGDRFNRTPSPDVLQSILWPGVSIGDLGLFTEASIPVAERTKLTAGLRYDFVHASADRTDDIAPGAMGKTPNDLYLQYYGVTAEDKYEHNFGGLLRLEHELQQGITISAGVSRSVRTADSTERYMASFMGAGGSKSWVGNPDIEPEKHHQVDLGLKLKQAQYDFSVTAFYNSVTDFIHRDSGREFGQPEVDIYRNIDATLAGVEAEATIRLAGHWKATLGAAYVYGQNETDDLPLPQIPPLSGKAELVYDMQSWLVGARVNFAADQNRVDADPTTGSGTDDGTTDGWATLDLFAAVNLTESFQVSGGVTNVFDKTYAYHLSRTNLLDPDGVKVNEPGRSFYLRGAMRF